MSLTSRGSDKTFSLAEARQTAPALRLEEAELLPAPVRGHTALLALSLDRFAVSLLRAQDCVCPAIPALPTNSIQMREMSCAYSSTLLFIFNHSV